MASETTIRLPARLVGVVRTDPAAAAPISIPCGSLGQAGLTETPAAAQGRERAEAESTLSKLGRAADASAAKDRHTLDDIRKAAIELAMAATSHFLMERIEHGDFPFDKLIGRALERLAPRQAATVRLHPEDLASLERGAQINLGQDTRFSADATLARGACKIETPDRTVLFDLENRLDLLRRTLHQAANEQ